jgi:recombination protein RecR
MGPLALEDLIVAFAKLPGIGRVTAQRLALYVVKRPREEAELLATALIGAKDQIDHCATCYNFTQRGEEQCAVCQDARRDQQFLCVVAEASDVLALEMSQVHSGVYHVLGGVLSPQDGVLPEDLQIDALVERVRERGVREVVLALNASAEGDATAHYISQQLTPLTKVSELARGLPVGADLDLADRVTLSHAFAGRSSL